MKRSNFTRALLVLASIIFLTHVVPLFLGLSFTPLPSGIVGQASNSGSPQTPAHHTAADAYTFPHVEWPWRIVERRAVQTGDMPLWNPNSSLGLPFPAQYQNQMFLPLEWIEVFLGGPVSWNALLAIKILLAGLGAALFLRRFCSSAPAIAVGALCYTYSGFFLWFYTVPAFVNGATLLPWAFLAFVSLADESLSKSRRVGQVALVTALLGLTGQPQMTALAFLSLAVLVVSLSVAGRRKEPLILAASGVALGLIIAAPQLLLFAEALSHGYSLHRSGAYTRTDTSALNLTISIFPFLLGQLMSPWLPSIYPGRANWEAFPVVIGTTGLLLGSLGLLTLVRRGPQGVRPVPVIAMTLVLGLAALIMLSSWLGLHVWRLPGFNRINFARYASPVLSLAIATLCAWGVENIRTISRKQVVAVMVLLAGATGVSSFAIFSMVGSTKEAIDPSYMKLSLALGYSPLLVITLSWLGIARLAVMRRVESQSAAWALVLLSAGELTFFVRYGLSLSDEMVRVALLAFVCVAAFGVAMRNRWGSRAPLIIACFGFVILLHTADRRLPPPVNLFESAPRHIAFLQTATKVGQRYSRVLSNPEAMRANIGGAFGLYELASLNPIQVERTAQVVLGFLAQRELDSRIPNQWPGMNEDPAAPSWDDYLMQRKWYNALGVEYLIDKPGGRLSHLQEQEQIKPVFSDANTVIYRDELSMPRAYTVSAVRFSEDLRNSISIMKEPGFDPRTSIVVEASSSEFSAELITGANASARALSIAHLGNTRVDIQLDVEAPAFAVLTDAYYPGWSAVVDGERRRVFPVNGALRGVFIKPGDKMLVFSYFPPGLRIALVLALSAAAFSIMLLVWPRGKRLLPHFLHSYRRHHHPT